MRAGVAFRNESKLGPYERALREAGIEPVRIPLDTPPPVESLDGLVLAGGTDINPARYGQQPAPETDQPDDQRDEVETRLLEGALAQGIPVLAICRGMQLFNVVHGGTLIQHLPAGGAHQVKQPDAVAHNVRVARGTRLAAILGEGDHGVNSRHHQAVDRPGRGLIVAAIAPDGVIEALERPGDSFAVAVEWHPEDRIFASAGDRKLFEAFAAALSAAPAARL
ncbi:MAG TPA: gamma-glutamyl-gamma-aminobutyrate hydrolase family protein [Bryobacteraceae bacterium]|nr:gamma-glutamyl-gamma-aminobutyrate hydrolase family protein [Bryobacteraceae bacterium]